MCDLELTETALLITALSENLWILGEVGLRFTSAYRGFGVTSRAPGARRLPFLEVPHGYGLRALAATGRSLTRWRPWATSG